MPLIATGVGGILVRCEMRIEGETVSVNVNHTAACGATPGDRSTYRTAPPGPAMEFAQRDKIMKLPRYPGKSSPVIGRLTDRAAGLSYARLGGGWGSPSREQQPGFDGRTLSLWVESRPERGWFAVYGSDRLSPEPLGRYRGVTRPGHDGEGRCRVPGAERPALGAGVRGRRAAARRFRHPSPGAVTSTVHRCLGARMACTRDHTTTTLTRAGRGARR